MTVTERAHAPRPSGYPLSAETVTGDYEPLAGEQHIGGPDDPVESGLARPVPVVEKMLRVRVVDGDDRVAQNPGRLHGPEPDHTGRRLLGAADDLPELARAELVET